MNAKRWVAVVVMGFASGLVWGALFVDRAPHWFDRLACVPAVSLLLVPLALSLLCGALFEWWRLRVVLTYAAMVVALHVAGTIYNQSLHSGGLRGWYWRVEEAAVGAGLIWACWSFGRLLRKGIRGELSLRPGSTAA